jgi:hypothetical protein
MVEETFILRLSMTNKIYKKFKHMVEKTMSEITDKVIIHTNNIYVVYNKYAIIKDGSGYLVHRRGDGREFSFNTMKHAVVWSILDSNLKCYEADRVLQLDKLLESVKVDTAIHTKLKNLGDMEKFMINTIKLQTDRDRQRQFISELNKYIITADICHKKGLKNELTRTSRK